MEPEGSLQRSQVPATYPYPEQDRYSPCPHILLPEYPSSYNTLTSHLRLGLPSDLSSLGLSTKILYTPLLSPYVLHIQPMSLVLREKKYLLVNKPSTCCRVCWLRNSSHCFRSRVHFLVSESLFLDPSPVEIHQAPYSNNLSLLVTYYYFPIYASMIQLVSFLEL
jgi:hypothetical protein